MFPLSTVAPPSAPGRDPALESALLRRTERWHAASARAKRLATRRARDIDDALDLVEDYRLLARDLAIARRLIPDSRAREYLESAYAQAHAALHRSRAHPLRALASLLRDGIPEVVAELRPHIGWVTALLALSAVAGFALVHAYPDLIALFASPEMIAAVDRGELWTAGLLSIAPSSLISAQVLTNNIVVSLFAFCAGFLFGLGTFYIVALNGLTLGAVFAFTAQHGLAGPLFAFVLPHGCVELSVMCLSGAAGAAVGEALIRPSAASRARSFQITALRAGKLLVACVLLLAVCGVIEGYVSPDPRVPLWVRASLGAGYWLLMAAWLGGWLCGKRSGRPQEVSENGTRENYVV
ncbi:MAG TPA: stage II sporulation protein M [Steroidobacteraceae bacterium]|nr:stage II sporulation protein M [Steroidobacteraceae bacterium]